jgi:hypothetical protein
MRVNHDGRTVAAMDVLAPGIGEVICGCMVERGTDWEHCAPTLPSPASGRAVRGMGDGCEVTILCNQIGSPWPDLVMTKSGHPRLRRGDRGRLKTWIVW